MSTSCKFRGATCYKCGKHGHISTVCRASGVKKTSVQTSARTQWLHAEGQSESEEEDLGIFNVQSTSGKSRFPPITVVVKINGCNVSMEVDMGAAVSFVSEQTYHKCFGSVSLELTHTILETYIIQLSHSRY